MAASGVESNQQVEENVETPDNSELDRDAISTIEKTERLGVPLQTAWTFWLDRSIRGTSAAQYESSLRKVYTVSTVQGFWSVYNNIPTVSQLNVRYSYHLMRQERRPIWEDPCNCRGGNWRFKCSKNDTPTIWKELLLAAIGEQFTEVMAEGDEIGGLSVSIRDREDIVQIWNARADIHEGSEVITKVKELLPSVPFSAIFYKAFQTHQAFEGAKG